MWVIQRGYGHFGSFTRWTGESNEILEETTKDWGLRLEL
jgi:hypothetical protein